MDSTFSRHSPGFYLFSVLTLIRPFFCNRRYWFSIVARILPFLGTLPDSTIFRYSHWFSHFSILVRILIFSDWNWCGRSRKDHFYMSIWNICLQKNAFCFMQCTCNISKMYVEYFQWYGGADYGGFHGWHHRIWRYIWGMFFRYSPGFYPFSVLTLILPFSETHPDCFSIVARILPFPRYSPGFYHFPVLIVILPFSETRPDSFSIVAQILPFLGTRLDSTRFRY